MGVASCVLIIVLTLSHGCLISGSEESQSCSARRDAAGLLGSRPQILLFGDSITEHGSERYGWASELSLIYTRKADVINRGFSGYNSAVALSMLTQSTEKDIHGDGSRTLMLIFFGANDATAPDYHLHVPVDEYGENLRRMVRKCQEVMPGITIVLVTPPPIDEPKLMEFDWYAGRSKELASAYAEEAARAAQDTGVLLLDIHNLMFQSPQWKDLLSDGLHLSPIGNAFLVEQLIDLLNTTPSAQKWRPESMMHHYPRNIDVFKKLDHLRQREAKICEWPDASGTYCFQQRPE